jgi:hypothetical protein
MKLLTKLINLNVIKRTIIMWLGSQAILWTVFFIGYLINKEAWNNIPETLGNTSTYMSTFWFIIGSNAIICLLIFIGNVFVRFGSVSPGILILLIQLITIGWIAGSNDFEFPFSSVYQANLQYLRVGLWEVTSYILICSVSLTKSLYISDTFPAKKWISTKKLRDIKFSKSEIFIVIIALISLIMAAVIETITL